MAKFRMNHSRQGRGAGANVIRMFAVVFFLLIIFFLVMGRNHLSSRLDDSILFDSSNEVYPSDSLMLSFFGEINDLVNPHLGLDTSSIENRYAYLPSCSAFEGDSITFNSMYFIPTEWLVDLKVAFYEDFYRSSNLSGLNYGVVKKKNRFKPATSDCSGIFIKVTKGEDKLSYLFYIENKDHQLVRTDSIVLDY